MTRVSTSNYAGTATTTFMWATAGTDRFSRTSDLYYLAQAVENHDHSVGKGLAVSRIANNAVDTDQLATGAVTTAKVEDLAVTAAKIADLTIASGKIAADAVTTAKILDANVTTAKLATDAVTTVKITDLNVTTAKINDLAVTAGKLAADAVTTAKILDANVTTAKIADSNVTTAKIADSNVTTAKIADLNVTTDKLAADAVTAAKLADDAVVTANLDTIDAPGTDEVLTYNGSALEWQAVSALQSASPGSRVGDVKLFAGKASALTAEAAAGWLNCDGTAVSRSTYSALFAVLDTTWGSGNGSTTFNLPDMRDFLPMGVSGTKAIGSTGGNATVDFSHDHGFTPQVQSATYNQTANTASGGGTHQTIGTHGHTGTAGVTDQGSSGVPLTTKNILNPYKAVYYLIYSGVAS